MFAPLDFDDPCHFSNRPTSPNKEFSCWTGCWKGYLSLPVYHCPSPCDDCPKKSTVCYQYYELCPQKCDECQLKPNRTTSGRSWNSQWITPSHNYFFLSITAPLLWCILIISLILPFLLHFIIASIRLHIPSVTIPIGYFFISFMNKSSLITIK